MINKFKFWLFTNLLLSLKSQIIDGTYNLLNVISPKELFAFTKLFTRRQSFVREIRTVNVKKGKRKYTLLFVQTLDGEVRFNLGRHRTTVDDYKTMSLNTMSL